MASRSRLVPMLALAMLAGFVEPAAGQSTALAIDRQGFIPVGGIEQRVSMRGASADNPALLFLHGGPGEAHSPFLSAFEPWERAFTVVLWDQRGSGKTFGRNPSALEDMRLERLTLDAIEIAEHALRELGREKLIVVGQSWGSMIGWRAAQARPDLFHAYVVTGQAVSWAHTVAGQEAYARAQALAAGDDAALAAMDEVRAQPMSSFARTAPFRSWIMPASDLAYIDEQREFVGPEPLPETGDVADWVRGFGFSVQALGAEVLRFDAYTDGPEVEIPFFVFQGRDNHITPSAAGEQLVRDAVARAKAYVAIDGGHFVCYTHADAFAATLIEHVVPLAR